MSSSSSTRSRPAGLVSRQTVRHGVGRPRHVYDVTAAAQDLFPTNYDGLASGLLAAIRAIGGEELVGGVFDERRRMTTRPHPAADGRAPHTGGAPRRPGTRARRDPGRAGLPRRGGARRRRVIRLVERNCAIHHVLPTTAPRARPSSTSSARSWAPTSSGRRTSPPATAAARTASAAPATRAPRPTTRCARKTEGARRRHR